MCGAANGNKSGGGGGGGGGKKKAKSPLDIIHKWVTPTKDSIAKNKVAGAKHTASQRAKGIGVARSNFTDSQGKKIKGVVNSKTNPALVKLAREGKTGAAGLKELSRQQAATLDKDTSFKGIWKSLSTGEKHKPVESLLQFGTRGRGGPQPNAYGGKYKAASGPKPAKPALTVDNSAGGSSGGASQETALAGGVAATATSQPDNLKNLLAIKKNAQRQGKRKLRLARNTSVGFGNGGVGLNITT